MSYDVTAAQLRCKNYRRRILDLSQRLGALHIAPAYSCLEILDTIYFGLMKRDGAHPDTFILSKGHGAIGWYTILEKIGVLSSQQFETCCQSGSHLGGHPDRGNPGVEASTGSLGHGFPIAVGIARGEIERKSGASVYTVISDGELFEGSTWETFLVTPNIHVHNITVFIDNNGSISRGSIGQHHPNVNPILPKITAFGWDVKEVDGHDIEAVLTAAKTKTSEKPLAVICKTVKGKGVSYMENKPIWAYRSPNKEEYQIAMKELEAA